MMRNRLVGAAAAMALVALCVWAGAEGYALVNRAAEMPAFTDPGRALWLRSHPSPAGREAWWREMNALITDKWDLVEFR